MTKEKMKILYNKSNEYVTMMLELGRNNYKIMKQFTL